MIRTGNAGDAGSAERIEPVRAEREERASHRAVLVAATVFAVTGLALQWWRLEVLSASYDQGIFLQVMWNGLRGHPFESTLSSQLSTNVVHADQLPALGYHRLGQHFTPALLLWMPLVAVAGAWALPLVQVGLMTAAGLALHSLALKQVGQPRLAAFLACSYFGANAVLGPTWGNFTDLCQLPLAFFLLLLALERRSWWLVALMALLLPMIREDTGVLLAGVALWMLIRRRELWPLALALGVVGLGWVLVVTNLLMPLFSEDNARRFMVENFGQFLGGDEKASSLDVLGRILAQPTALLGEVLHEPGETIRYLLAQGLPLLFVPLISLDSWLLMGLPFLGLLLARGKPSPFSINVRYALLVVPGLFAGAVLWWQTHPLAFGGRRLRAFWVGAIVLSLLFTIGSNPNRSLSFVIPDSVTPWIHTSPVRLWQHGRAARRVLAAVPAEASVAASTPLVPLLAQREVLVRFPRSWRYLDRQEQARAVDWLAADLEILSRHLSVSRGDRVELALSLDRVDELSGTYGMVALEDGVLLLQRGASDDPAVRRTWADQRSQLEAELARFPQPG